ncbi:MAG: aminotransferase class I/II-fold pyridoxal phosphate-dependent enzyme [Candidatus Hermodarchaeota archaeon]
MKLKDSLNPENQKISNFGYSGIFGEIEKFSKEHPNCLHLSNCDPPIFGYTLDESIKNQINKLQISQYTGYPRWNGDEALRNALSQRIHRICKVKIPSNKIILTNGVSECFPLTFAALSHQAIGSIAIPDPSYIPLIVQAGRFSKVWFYPCNEEDNWNPDLDHVVRSLEKYSETKAIVVITPNSPTGVVYPEKILKELINIAGQYNLIIISNEIYDSLSFGGFSSPLQFANEVPIIYLNGFSKVYRIPGYRLGYLGLYDPLNKFPDLWDYLEQLSRVRFGVSSLAQEIAKLALQEPEKTLKAYVESVYKKQTFLTRLLEAVEGITVVPANGATYVFPKINLDINDEKIVEHLIQKHEIIVTPGSAYGPTIAPGHLRFVSLAPEENLLKGVQALEKTLHDLG